MSQCLGLVVPVKVAMVILLRQVVADVVVKLVTKEEVERWEWVVSVPGPDQPLAFDSDCSCHERLRVSAVQLSHRGKVSLLR